MGVDAAVETARSAWALKGREDILSSVAQSFGEASQGNRKEEQFEQLRAGLREIEHLARLCTPIAVSKEVDEHGSAQRPLILLIDDLQWVDDFTAEFLLKEWPADLVIYVIATARGSDCFTTTADSAVSYTINQHRHQLFVELGLLEGDPTTPPPAKKTSVGAANHMELRGMSQPMLTRLIKLTYSGITPDQARHFSEAVTNYLAPESPTFETITLFAVETLNVISDPQFYVRNPVLPRLVEPLPMTDRYRFRMPVSESLENALEQVFRHLSKAYEISYLQQAGEASLVTRFNLPSYAVLEERLHQIEHYFSQYDITARYSLLFSALLGSPFQSELVQHIVEDLKSLVPKEHTELSALIQELQEKSRGRLGLKEYELLERAYEIIRRLEATIAMTNRYVYQHGLLQQFLLGQFTQLLNRLYPEPEALEAGMQALVNQVELCGNQWFDDQQASAERDLPDDGVLEIERHEFLVALIGYWYRFMRDRTSEVGDWTERYGVRLNDLAVTHSKWGRLEEALKLHEESLSLKGMDHDKRVNHPNKSYASSLNNLAIILKDLGRAEDSLSFCEEAVKIGRDGYELDPQCWAELYAGSLNVLASVLRHLGLPTNALPFQKEALVIRRAEFDTSPDHWAGDYAESLNNQGLTLDKLGRAEDALALYQKALSICGPRYEKSPDDWVERYTITLNNLACGLDSLRRPEEALPLWEEVLSIQLRGYEANPERWTEGYATSLNNLAQNLATLDRQEEALLVYEKALSIQLKGYETSPERWAQPHASVLRNLANALQTLGRLEDALALYEKALAIQRSGYESSAERWAEDYARTLDDLASVQNELGRSKEALGLHQEALSIWRSCYEESPDRWAVCYAKSLANLASVQSDLGHSKEALVLHKEALSIWRPRYEQSPGLWAKNYASMLNNLGITLNDLGRLKEALALHEEALSIRGPRYEEFPDRWAEDYASTLTNLGATLDKLGRSKEALASYQEAVLIRRQGYQIAPDRWAKACSNSLNYLAFVLVALNRLEEATPLFKEVVSILRQQYETYPERCTEDYARSLSNLAVALNEIGRLKEALSLYKEALSIHRQNYDSAPERCAANYAACLRNLALALEDGEEHDSHAHADALALWRQIQELTSDGLLIPHEDRLSRRMESMIHSSRLLRKSKRLSDAFIELDKSDAVLTEMLTIKHPERHFFEAWAMLDRVASHLERGDIAAAKAMVSSAGDLIREHNIESLGGGLGSLCSHIEAAEETPRG